MGGFAHLQSGVRGAHTLTRELSRVQHSLIWTLKGGVLPALEFSFPTPRPEAKSLPHTLQSIFPPHLTKRTGKNWKQCGPAALKQGDRREELTAPGAKPVLGMQQSQAGS